MLARKLTPFLKRPVVTASGPVFPQTLTGFITGSPYSVPAFRAASKLSQDSGKTTPATTNTAPVRVMEADGVDWTASADANRPLLTNEGTDKWSLGFDGSNDALASASITHGIGTGNFWLIARIVAGTSGAYSPWFSNNTLNFALYLDSGVLVVLVGGGGTEYRFDSTLSAGTKYTVEVARVAGDLKAWVDGSQEATTHTGTGFSVSNGAWRLGTDAGAAFSNTRVAGLLMCAAAPSQESTARTFFGGLA
jgi:hypothetical protein